MGTKGGVDALPKAGSTEASSAIRCPRCGSASQSIEGGSRLSLRPREAAVALGVSERKLREMLPELPRVRIGGVVLLPVKPLEAWLAEQAKTEANRGDRDAREIVQALERGRR